VVESSKAVGDVGLIPTALGDKFKYNPKIITLIIPVLYQSRAEAFWFDWSFSILKLWISFKGSPVVVRI
jgi:hypothetical protein